MKTCTKCEVEKPDGQFPKNGDGRLRSSCVICERKRNGTYRSDAAERLKAYHSQYRQDNRDRLRSRDRGRRLQYKYGISTEERDALIAAQGGLCLLCETNWSGTKGRTWAVDHNHATGEVRGILCHSCNTRLGRIETAGPEWLAAAIEYVGWSE